METKPCTICKGSGSLSCWMCEGTGQLGRENFYVMLQNGDGTCVECSGKGILQCSNCEGQGIVPVSKEIECPHCNGDKSVPCFWCEGKGVISNIRGCPEKRCVHCQGTGNRTCPDCGGGGTITAELKSAPLEEWRRRLGGQFERIMLIALSEWLGTKNPGSIWMGDSSDSTPSPKCEPYQLIDEFESLLRAEDPDGLDAAYEDPGHPYKFISFLCAVRRCGTTGGTT